MTNRFRLITIKLSLVGFAAFLSPCSNADESAAPFAFGDFSWMPGNFGPSESRLVTKYFTPEIRLDSAYHYSFANPKDNTISGSSEVFRHQELQLTQIGVGGDFNVDNVGFRLMTQFGMYSQSTPRNDPSSERGQWQTADAYRYISEAYGSYHLDYDHGINIQAGIFMSYVGLWSYYNFDNWTYQPSYVSSNTPWFFNGVRVQYFPTDKLKIEPWLINGWQAYGMFNNSPGLGLQVAWRPAEWFGFTSNNYYGADTLNTPDRKRMHTDNSAMVRYYIRDSAGLSRAAASLTVDAGCESGGGTDCERSYFLGFMAYNRLWFNHNRYGLTIGGGMINNPGRYLVLVPPINGATAYSGAPTWFTANPGDPYRAWDVQVSGDYSPTRNLTFRLEYNHRWASIPYFTGPEGVTPPGGNVGTPGSDPGTGWAPDLVQTEDRITASMLIRL
ncbi:MAG: outer membrane beta-barrel protein [Bdellovibrionales bacterium]|nr:outer membrane beta-barrel protein [Bdellovibrionales bacterium]